MSINLSINIKNKKCIIAGAGSVAERKAETLLKYGAKITIIAPEIRSTNLQALISNEKLNYIKDRFDLKYTDNAFLVIMATDSKDINEKFAEELDKKNILVNNATGDGNTAFTAILDRGELQIAVSTSGNGPLFAAAVRDKISKLITGDFKKLLGVYNEYREKAINEINDIKKRNDFLNKAISILMDEENHDIKSMKDKINKVYKEAR